MVSPMVSPRARSLLRLDAGFLDHTRPLRRLGAHELTEFRAAHAQRLPRAHPPPTPSRPLGRPLPPPPPPPPPSRPPRPAPPPPPPAARARPRGGGGGGAA